MPHVLVWPAAGQAESEVRRELTGVATDHLSVGVWDPTADDHGRTALLTSVRAARDLIIAGGGDPDDLALVGFGQGAVAAAGLTRYARRLGIGLGPVICVAPTWHEPDPFSSDLIEEVPEGVELVDRADDVPAVLLTCWRRR